MIPKITDMIPWEEARAREQHQRELLKEANHQRSIRQVSKRETTSYQLLLARLGERLVKWGCRLQAKYGTLAEASNSICYVKMLRQQFLAPDTSINLSLCLGKK